MAKRLSHVGGRVASPGKGAERALAALAQHLADVRESIACAGTKLESRSFTVRGKAFLFVRSVDARLKLEASRAEAARLSAADPAHYNLGANGWTTIRFSDGYTPDSELAARWVNESYRLMAGPAVPKDHAPGR